MSFWLGLSQSMDFLPHPRPLPASGRGELGENKVRCEAPHLVFAFFPLPGGRGPGGWGAKTGGILILRRPYHFGRNCCQCKIEMSLFLQSRNDPWPKGYPQFLVRVIQGRG